MYDRSDPEVAAAAAAAAAFSAGRNDFLNRRRAGQLPSTLFEALDNLDDSAALRGGLGDGFVDAYLKLRRQHWEEYTAQLSQWEVETYLDC